MAESTGKPTSTKAPKASPLSRKALEGHLRVVLKDLLAQLRGRRILDARRRRSVQLLLLGFACTLFALSLDLLGALRGVENWFYDQRTLLFQFTMPQPSPRIVHLDIDDGSIDVIGRWPWSRFDQARILSELNRANPKLVFLDVIQDRPEEEKRDPKAPPTTKPSEADLAYSEMLKTSGKTLLPISANLDIRPAPTPLETRMVGEMITSLSLGPDELAARLVSGGFEEGLVREAVKVKYAAARDKAADAIVLGELQANPQVTADDLRTKFFPNLDRTTRRTPVLEVLARRLEALRQERRIQQFGRAIPQGIPELLRPNYTASPMILFSEHAAYSGFVDFVREREEESTVRFVPLFVNLNGRMIPHVSLQIACAFLNVKLEDLVISTDRVVIPAGPDHGEIVLPVRTILREGKEPVPFVMDIPWFGGRQWLAMYDVPEHKVVRQHISTLKLWNIIEATDKLDGNLESLRAAVVQAYQFLDDPDTANMVRTLPFDTATDRLQGLSGLWENGVIPARDALAGKTIRSPREAETLALIGKLDRIRATSVDQSVKLIDQIEKDRAALRPVLEGKVILFGFTATGRADFYPTPVHALAPGIVAHGALVNGIVTGHLWGRAPAYYTHLLTVVLGVVTTFFVALTSPWKSAVGALSTIATYVFLNGFVLFDRYDVVVGVAGPMTAMGLTWAGVTLIRFILEIVERNRITARFSNYVDPQVVNFILENPDQANFTGQERVMTVVFTDLEGFTTLSEKLGTKTVAILNEYVAAMTPLIRAHNGVIDKFLGDGIMFQFNAVLPNPDHAADALKAVLDMQQAMFPINQRLVDRGLSTLKMRVGVNTGQMIVGDAGGGGMSNFTVLGDNVNLAARLESANKAFGSLMLMADTTYELAGGAAGPFAVRPMARLRVKGKEKAVMTYEPLGLKEELTDAQRRVIELSEAIFDSFVAGRFEACMTACDRMTAEIGETKYAKLYHKESVVLLAEGAGPDFDGTVTLSEK